MKAGNCPKCGKPLKINATGRIGYCTLHKQWFPVIEGSEAEAAAQNAADEKAAKETRLEKERQEQEKIRQEQERQHSANVRKAVIALIAVLAVAACVVFFIVRPSVNFKSAEAKFKEGAYEEALEAYTSLGSYKDSSAKAAFCSAMIGLSNGETETAVETLAGLVSDGSILADSLMAEKLIEVLSGWKENGLSPESALQLLSSLTESGFGDDRINAEELSVQVHSSMLDGEVLEYEAYDVDGNGEKEMAVLNADYTVSVYHMNSEGNTPANIDKETLSHVAVHFAEKLMEEDSESALKCFMTAYDLSPSDENRDALADCYRQIAAEKEESGDIDSAIDSTEQAMLLTRTKEDFDSFYALNLKRCKGNKDTSIAISEWETFGEENESSLKKYKDDNQWKLDTGQLHLDRAAELAAEKDLSCAEDLRTAADLGVDVTEAINSAMSYFDEGLALTSLRIMAINIAEGDDDLQATLTEQMADGIRTAVSEWQSNGINPKEIPVLFKIADEQGVDLSGIDKKSIYETAAVDASGQLAQYSFVDWNNDGYEELLGIDKEGNLCLFGIQDSWEKVSSMDTGIKDPEYVITDMNAPVMVVVSSEKDNMIAVTCKEDQLKELFREEDICRYNRTGEEIAFSRLLDDSIERFEEYSYTAVGADSRPQRTGIDWQQDNYPYPESGYDAIQRYFEAKFYDIPAEEELITDHTEMELYSAEELSALPIPKSLESINIQSFDTEDDAELFEVSYKSSGQDVRTWIKALYSDCWKVAGCADTYGESMDPSLPDFSIPLLSLNAEETGVIETKGETKLYRMLVPASGSGTLIWKAGDKDGKNNAFVISLYREEPYGDPEITYNLKPSGSRQQTNPIYLSPGVYYVSVEAKTDDAYGYSMTMKLEESTSVELEENDTPGSATSIVSDTGYSGSLLTSSDVDYFSLEVETPAGINVVLEFAGNRTKASAFTVELYSASTGSMLSSVSVPGNAPYSETGNVYVSAGTYLIKIYKGKEWTDETYTLTAKLIQNGTMEAEINDTPETANPVPVNEEIHASIAKEGDIDCFAFTLESDSIVQLSLDFTPTDSTSKTYIITVTDQSRTVYQVITIGGKESTKVNAPIALPAGVFIVKVENPAYIKQDYRLTIACQDTASSEREPNNSLALATELQVGQPVSGVISTQDDVDYYKVSFDEKQQVTIAFHFPQRTSTNTAFVLSIENNGKTLKKFDLRGDSGGMDAVIEFPAGEYYFKIKPSTWTSAIYTLGVL